MLKMIIGIFSLFVVKASLSQQYTPVDAGSKVHFVIKNFAISTGGDFAGLKGTIKFDPADLASASFSVSVDAATIDTDSEMRDEHLKENEYFDVVKYPSISFRSTKLARSGKNNGLYMFGDLTIKGITKPVEFGFTATAQNGGYLFNGEFEINRLDYNVGDKSISLQDKVKIVLKIFAQK